MKEWVAEMADRIRALGERMEANEERMNLRAEEERMREQLARFLFVTSADDTEYLSSVWDNDVKVVVSKERWRKKADAVMSLLRDQGWSR